MGEKILEKIELWFKEGGSDKVYNIQMIEYNDPVGVTKLYRVDFQYGRRGSTLNTGTKIVDVDKDAAQKAYNKVMGEKTGKGYKVMGGVTQLKKYVSGSTTSTSTEDESGFSAPPVRKLVMDGLEPIIPQLPIPIEESDVGVYLQDNRYGMEEKKDGKSLIVHKNCGLNLQTEEPLTVTNKKGKVCGYPKAFEAGLVNINKAQINGEGIGDVLHAYDLLELDGQDLRSLTYLERYEKLSWLHIRSGVEIVPLAIGYDEKKKLYDRLVAQKKEGVVFKLLDARFEAGKYETMRKFKFYAELSARVAKGREGKRSIGLELLDEKGAWQFVGNCTIGGKKEIPAVGSIVEIRYLYVAGVGGHLYQPSFKEPRDDIDESECLMTQIKYKGEED